MVEGGGWALTGSEGRGREEGGAMRSRNRQKEDSIGKAEGSREKEDVSGPGARLNEGNPRDGNPPPSLLP